MWYQRQKFQGYWWWRIRPLCSREHRAWPSYIECGETQGCGQICADPSGLWATTNPMGNHQPWELLPQGTGWLHPFPQGSGWLDPWPQVRPMPTHTSRPLPSRFQMPWQTNLHGVVQASQRPDHWESHAGCPWEAVLVVLVVPAEQCPCWSVGPCLSLPLAKVDESF